MNAELRAALERLVGQLAQGPLAHIRQAAFDEDMDRAVDALASYLGDGPGGPGTRRSAAIRMLIKRGAKGVLDDARARA